MTRKQHERCDIQIEPGRTIKLAPEANAEHLNEQQLSDYTEHRAEFIEWLRTRGKRPEKIEGYSDYTAYETAYRTARFDRWTWTREGRYSIPPTPEHATAYVENDVALRDVSNSTKGKTEEAIARYMDWTATVYDVSEWDHDQVFRSGGRDAPRDYLTRDERRKIREAALARGDWKTTSLILTALDAALRPVEVRRATTTWVDIGNRMLRIPREDSSKNIDNWRVSLTSRTANALREWIDERDELEVYNGRDELWLTREGTQYTSRSLARLTRSLARDAGISTRGRTLTLYALRHSTGTYLTEERDCEGAKLV